MSQLDAPWPSRLASMVRWLDAREHDLLGPRAGVEEFDAGMLVAG